MTRLNDANPYAPVYMSGPAAQGDSWRDEGFDYPYQVTLTSNQSLTDQAVTMDKDAPWVMGGLLVTANTGAFTLQLYDSTQRQLFNQSIISANFFVGTEPTLFVLASGPIIPASGQFTLDIADISGAGNTIQILFRGWKRYPIPGMNRR